MAQVTWSRSALASLNAIFAHLYAVNPTAAGKVFLDLREAAASLDSMPDRGRPIGGGRRELLHLRPYVVRYRVAANKVTILQVRHAARAPD